MEVTHDYVDYETAKLLRDKGFNYHKICEDFSNYYDYDIKSEYHRRHESDFNLENYPEYPWIPVPEHWVVIKWLRVVHSIFIGIELIDNSRETCYQPTIWTMKDREYQDEDCMDQAKSICNWKEWKYSTPEEAELEAIKYCLNNLINGK